MQDQPTPITAYTLPPRFYLVAGAARHGGSLFTMEMDADAPQTVEQALTACDQFDEGVYQVLLIDSAAGTVTDATKDIAQALIDRDEGIDGEAAAEWAYEALGYDRDDVQREINAHEAGMAAQNDAVARGVYSR